MANLPAVWRELERPARLDDIDLFISGDGSGWELPVQLQHGEPLAGTDLTGMEIDAEIRSDGDDLLLLLTAAFVAQATGSCMISATDVQVVGIKIPCDAPPRGKRFKLGRMQFAVTDDAGRWVLMVADVWANR